MNPDHATAAAARWIAELRAENAQLRARIVELESAPTAQAPSKMTQREKRAAVIKLLVDPRWVGLTNRKLAEMSGTSHAYVGILRRQLARDGKLAAPIEPAIAPADPSTPGNVAPAPTLSPELQTLVLDHMGLVRTALGEFRRKNRPNPDIIEDLESAGMAELCRAASVYAADALPGETFADFASREITRAFRRLFYRERGCSGGVGRIDRVLSLDFPTGDSDAPLSDLTPDRDDDDTPISAATRAKLAAVNAALDQLPARQATAARQFYGSGGRQSYRAIAAEMRATPAAVENLLHRARTRVREIVAAV